MKHQKMIFVGVGIGVITLLLLAFCLLGFYALTQFQTLAQVGKGLGTQPPPFYEAKAALPMHVGAYTLDKETVHSVGMFYESNVDDGYSGTYIGTDGEAKLIIIHTNSPDTAINYVKTKMDWVREHRTDTQLNIDLPSKTLVIYSVLEHHGQTWSSQEWVISIEASNREVRDAFYEALPYR